MSHSSLPDSSTGGVFSNLWWALPPLLMGILAISGQSFWIDECMTARFVSEPTLAAWWHDMRTTTYPEAQMPLYLFYLWGWDKLCGHSEWSLRLAVLPWFVPGVAAFLYSLRRVGSRGLAIILVTCSSAFLWYYLNEARLYAMQAAVSCLIFAALAECHSSPQNPSRTWFLTLALGLLLLSAISIIGMIWASAAILAAWGLSPVSTLKQWGSRYRILIVAIVGLLGVLAAYYLSTVSRGAKATMIGTTNWQTVAFILYEQLGFTGLGPGRNELREQGVHSLLRYWPALCLYAIAVGTVLLAGLRVAWQSPIRRQALWIVAGVGIPAAFFLAAGMLAHFRVLGRHLTPLMPVWLCLLSLGTVRLWQRGLAGRTVVVLFLGLSLASAFEVRWASRHEKDDYRSAVAFSKAVLDSGRSVWWNASHEAATHYGLPLTLDPQQTGKALQIFNPTASALAQLPLPDFVVITKPDIYDHELRVMNFLTQSGYQPKTNFPAFVIWSRHP
jgi:hypothetical protein